MVQPRTFQAEGNHVKREGKIKERAHLVDQSRTGCLPHTGHKWDIYSWSQHRKASHPRSLPGSECWDLGGRQQESQGFIARTCRKICFRKIKVCGIAKGKHPEKLKD